MSLEIKNESVDSVLFNNSKMSIEINTLLKLVPCFDTNQNEQVYRFIRSCDSAFHLASTEQKSILLVYALNNITGVGAADVHSKTYDSWPDLKAYLIEKFSNVKTVSHLSLELQSMFQKPNETITEYFHRVDLCRSKIIEKLIAEISDNTLVGRKTTTEETALNVFINGLSTDIGTMLRTMNFVNLSEAGRFAMQEDKIRAMNTARQSLFQHSKSLPNRLPLQHRSHHNTNKILPNQNHPPKFNNPSQINNKICNYCKFPGHVISECRKRQYNNNYQNQRALPAPPRHVNNLNSQPFNEESNSLDIAHIAQNLDDLQL